MPASSARGRKALRAIIPGLHSLRRAASIVLFAMTAVAGAAVDTAAEDYSQRLDALWDFDHPATSEARFRSEAARHPPQSREAVEAATQVARSQGLQRHFTETDATLDAVERTLDAQPARIRVRYLLERGRRQNSSGQPAEAVKWFERALTASAADRLPGAAYYRVDALHMLAIAAPRDKQLDWHREALAAAESAPDARTRGWRASLLHNLGWTMHDKGDYTAALDYWQQALAAREAAHDASRTRIARWTVARGLRSVGRLDEAEAMQRALAEEFAAANAPDGYVFEELAEIAVAKGDRVAARAWAAKAHALLSQDADLRANDPARLARLAALAQQTAGP
jgi:tetratricopeptide (TPR) repeat protein